MWSVKISRTSGLGIKAPSKDSERTIWRGATREKGRGGRTVKGRFPVHAQAPVHALQLGPVGARTGNPSGPAMGGSLCMLPTISAFDVSGLARRFEVGDNHEDV